MDPILFFAMIVEIPILFLFFSYHISTLRNTTHPILKYKEFKSNFNINPDKWRTITDWELGYTHGENEIRVYINTLHGYLKARHDINKQFSKKCATKELENKHELIKMWQKDIDEYKKKEYEEAKKQLKENSIYLFTKDQEDLIKKAAIWYYQKLGAKNVEAITEKVAESITLDGILATGELDKIIK